jgi:4-hydroxy-tetrahydrodipicolinate synthase
MSLPRLCGIVPPLPTPLHEDGSIDGPGVEHLVEFEVTAGVHGLWVLGTTGRFDLIPDADQRVVAERAVTACAGRVPVVLNVSDQGTQRTLERARRFDDLAIDYYAALPPWYLPLTRVEILDYFRRLADELARPLLIYNAPWVCNQLTLAELRTLAEHPRIAGCKDVGPSLNATQAWPEAERRQQDFTYLAGTDNLDQATCLGADGFVSSLTNAFPELAVAIWDAARAGNLARSGRLQVQWLRLAYASNLAPMLACLEVMCQHRGILDHMLPSPLRALDADTARRVLELVVAAGELPQAEDEEGLAAPERIGGDRVPENG